MSGYSQHYIISGVLSIHCYRRKFTYLPMLWKAMKTMGRRAKNGNTCYSCVGSCARTESEASRRVSWRGWLGLAGLARHRAGWPGGAGGPPRPARPPARLARCHTAQLRQLFSFFSLSTKFRKKVLKKKMHENWWELVVSDRMYVRRPEDGLEKLINCLFEGTEVTQTMSRLHCVVSDCFCGHQVQRRTSESRAAQAACTASSDTSGRPPPALAHPRKRWDNSNLNQHTASWVVHGSLVNCLLKTKV